MKSILKRVLSAYPIGSISKTELVSGGILHQTYIVTSTKGAFILQQLNPEIQPSVLTDIVGITTYLSKKGIVIPRLVSTHTDEYFYFDGSLHWRLYTYIQGSILTQPPTKEQAYSAGRLVGSFHAALTDYPHKLVHNIADFRCIEKQVQKLRLIEKNKHYANKRADLKALLEEVHARYAALETIPVTLPLRLLHGDLKINNIIFDATETNAIALIDLDTIGCYPLPLELGDMLRSWCLVKKPKLGTSSFNPLLWHAVLSGYQETVTFMLPEEKRAISQGFVQITLELAIRFLIDAFEEKFFAFDARAYGSLYEQNKEKTEKYLLLLRDFELQKDTL